MKGFGFGDQALTQGAAVQPVINELGIDFGNVISKRSKSMYFMIRRKGYATVTQIKVLAPSSIDEASSLLKDYEEKVKLLAGGTDILPLMKDRVRTPEYVLDLNSVSGLKNIRNGPDGEINVINLSKRFVA